MAPSCNLYCSRSSAYVSFISSPDPETKIYTPTAATPSSNIEINISKLSFLETLGNLDEVFFGTASTGVISVFSETGFERKSKSGMSKLEWPKIGKVVVREHFYILVGNQKGMAPVPKRCLSIPQMQQLEKWARDKLTSEL